MRFFRHHLFIAALAYGLLVQSSQAQQAAQQIRFAKQPAERGQVASQAVATRMQLDVSIQQGAQTLRQEKSTVQRRQDRIIRLTRVQQDRPVAAEVTYQKATETVSRQGGDTSEQELPVTGKTYVVERQEDDLWITDDKGNIPTQEEFEIVANTMEAFGKPNPLAEFLVGKTVAVGQTLRLPELAAQQILAMGDELVQIEQFDLTLAEVREDKAEQRAVFHAQVSSRSAGRGQLGMDIRGQIIIDAATCRVVQLDLSGPIGMTESQPAGDTTLLVSGRGKIEVALRSAVARR